MTAEPQQFPPTHNTMQVNDLELRFRAQLDQLPIIRAIAGTIATQADFDLDAIADFRLAVDETCSILITNASSEGAMVCHFLIDSDELRFTGSVPTATGVPPEANVFGWQVNTTRTDSARSWITRNGHGETVHVELAKRKSTAGR